VANELYQLGVFINQTLQASSGLTALVGTRVYPEFAPQNAVYPMVIYGLISSPDRNAVGADRRMFTEPLMIVRGVVSSPSSWVVASQIADAIDSALVGANNLSVLSPAIHIHGCFREMAVRYSEVPQGTSGTRFQHVGGRYRFFVAQNA
jgi:hypothetical protein